MSRRLIMSEGSEELQDVWGRFEQFVPFFMRPDTEETEET